VQELKLTNVLFHQLQPLEDLPDLLRFADIHLVIQQKGAADAVLPSKVTGILAVGGQAIVTAEPHTELGLILTANPEVATLIPPQNVDALANAISQLADDVDPNERSHNQFAREYAEKHLAKESILQDFEDFLYCFTEYWKQEERRKKSRTVDISPEYEHSRNVL